MGKRHGKNATANPVYSHSEVQKDNKYSGWGLISNRLGKDSLKDFDCCSLTLQPCRNPVVTPDGYLFDKEAILEYIVRKKLDIAKQLKAYEKWRTKTENEEKELKDAERQAQVERFQKTSTKVTTVDTEAKSTQPKPNNFWGMAARNSDALGTAKEKPDTVVRCPVSGKPIKACDFVPVKFTPMISDDKAPLASKSERWMCAVTRDVLTNFTPCAALRTSGNIVTMECVDNLIRKDMVDPTNGKKMTEKDIIPLQRGGSGYAGSGAKLESKISKPSMAVG